NLTPDSPQPRGAITLNVLSKMKLRSLTQTVGKSEGGGSFIATTLVIPFGGSVELDHSDIIIRTFCYHTRITLQNYVAFRFYRWWSVLNYRAIIRHNGAYRAVGFRGRHQFKDPIFFENLGYRIERVERFWRRSSDEQDKIDYDLDFSAS
ncbi:MAG: hypothetical protein WCK77_24290, partial [Verrucomicrobiota bacterium]